jgi:hypothetical protein
VLSGQSPWAEKERQREGDPEPDTRADSKAAESSVQVAVAPSLGEWLRVCSWDPGKDGLLTFGTGTRNFGLGGFTGFHLLWSPCAHSLSWTSAAL